MLDSPITPIVRGRDRRTDSFCWRIEERSDASLASSSFSLSSSPALGGAAILLVVEELATAGGKKIAERTIRPKLRINSLICCEEDIFRGIHRMLHVLDR